MQDIPQERSQADSGALYSGAQSFLSFLEKGVDPRTGTYSIRVALPKIAMNALAGPDLSLSLAFDPLQNVDAGLGRGWSWAMTRLLPATKRLTLSDGETHLAIVYPDRIEFPDRKLPTFAVQKQDKTVIVTYKSGRRERLVMFDESDPLSPYVPVEIVSAQGRSIYLQWQHFAGHASLVGIDDHERKPLLLVTRSDQAVTLTLPGAGPGATSVDYVMTLNGDLVSAIRLPVPEQAVWQLRYERYTEADLPFLTQVISPTGSVETLAYEEEGHAFPRRAGDPPDKLPERLPYVVRHVMDPGEGLPQRISTYQYSTNNFLGFGAGVDWEDATDALYKVLVDYRYHSTQTQLGPQGEPLVTIYREFDRFHLRRIERRIEDGCEHETLETYHDQPGKPFADQSAIVQLPAERIERFRRDSVFRDDVTTFRYDDYGNPVETLTPDGIREQITYYNPAGETGCPADPVWPTPRTMKSKAIVASTAAWVRRGSARQTPTRTTRYRYGLLPSLVAGAPGFLECIGETLETPGEIHTTVTAEYYDEPASLLRHGRVKRRTRMMWAWQTIVDFTYQLSGDALVTTQTQHTDFDTTRSTTAIHVSVRTGLETQRDGADARVTFVHDALGRIVESTTTPMSGDSTYTASVRHSYFLVGQAGGNVRQVTANEFGVEDTRVFDGTGLDVSTLRREPDVEQGAAFEVRRCVYDTLGRLVSETITDVHDGTPLAATTQYRYDGWERQSAVIRPDGVTEHAEWNPITQEETIWLDTVAQRTGRVVRQRNAFDEVEWEERYDNGNRLISRQSYEYDGVGRCVAVTDPVGRVVTYEFDFADRVVRTMLPNGASGDVVERSYVAHSDENEVATLRVNGVEVGRRDLDGLLRKTSQTVGERVTLWEYHADRRQPSVVQNAAGERTVYDVDPSLTDHVKQRHADGVTTGFEYDPHSGLLTHARHESDGALPSEYHCLRYATGNLREVSYTGADGERVCRHTWSLLGLPLTYDDVAGNVYRYQYAPGIGRLTQIDCAGVAVSFAYDALGRVRQQQVHQAAQLRLTTTYTYDDVGREVQRDYDAPGQPGMSITQQYDATDALSVRQRVVGGQVMLTENFAYDPRGRIDLYYAIGEDAPRDPHLPTRRIMMQQWTFDAFDNIRQIISWPPTDEPSALVVYHYDNALDPTQLTSLVRTGYGSADGRETFRYDGAGRMIEAEQGHTVTYNALDQVTSIGRKDGAHVEYQYNSLDEQHRVVRAGQPVHERVFRENRLVTEIRGAFSRAYLGDGSAGAETLGDIDEAGALRVYATDWQASVVATHGPASASQRVVYGPTGYRADTATLDGVPGHDGELVDPLTQWLWLGNARMYSPVLGRFMVPDTFSPFDGGGVNAYARIDPVNAIDPSGHLPSWLGGVIGVLGVMAGIALTVVSAGGLSAAGAALALTGAATLGKVGVAAALTATGAVVSVSSGQLAVAASIITSSVAGMLSTADIVLSTTGASEVAQAFTVASGLVGMLGIGLAIAPARAAHQSVHRTMRSVVDRMRPSGRGLPVETPGFRQAARTAVTRLSSASPQVSRSGSVSSAGTVASLPSSPAPSTASTVGLTGLFANGAYQTFTNISGMASGSTSSGSYYSAPSQASSEIRRRQSGTAADESNEESTV
ncbi:RHS repeat domain-containing protein [Pandoraea sp. PE-S2R-1]|uniref:RHS repeat domain-containing protein n=1 Tax=Pandoraea sp. PE-S2R-1 TaxID=1986994 RepID=UPI00148301D9|nr:RHS repeat-associated core domain-containing protein [Pandoraea sp. PE-S2R-1]